MVWWELTQDNTVHAWRRVRQERCSYVPATLKPAVKDFRHPSEDTIATNRGDGDAVNTDGWVGGREGGRGREINKCDTKMSKNQQPGY